MSKNAFQCLNVKLLLAASTLLWLGTAAALPSGGWRWYEKKPPEPPHWSLELKYGNFKPELEEFKTFYGSDTTKHAAVGVAYKVLRTVEVGVEYGRMRNVGVGELPLNGTTGGNVTLTVNPMHAYVVLRGIWGEDQIGVPYIGGGVTRVSYKQSIENQPSRSGTADGNHWRYGLQFLLDRADPSLASEMRNDYGTSHTYLYIEKQHYEAKVDDIELGGDTTFIGLLFEF